MSHIYEGGSCYELTPFADFLCKKIEAASILFAAVLANEDIIASADDIADIFAVSRLLAVAGFRVSTQVSMASLPASILCFGMHVFCCRN